jgi:hypothetical protein
MRILALEGARKQVKHMPSCRLLRTAARGYQSKLSLLSKPRQALHQQPSQQLRMCCNSINAVGMVTHALRRGI